ncbi:hypothetical protein KUV22_17160, partial [Microbulbifer agarilyticus]|uniref:hypothetical protein n=1 Tax=Microbulbifer agarilyticus TaxID=260552 RepID=UPI001C97D43F
LVGNSECGRNNEARQDRPAPSGLGWDNLRCAPAAPASGVRLAQKREQTMYYIPLVLMVISFVALVVGLGETRDSVSKKLNARGYAVITIGLLAVLIQMYIYVEENKTKTMKKHDVLLDFALTTRSIWDARFTENRKNNCLLLKELSRSRLSILEPSSFDQKQIEELLVACESPNDIAGVKYSAHAVMVSVCEWLKPDDPHIPLRSILDCRSFEIPWSKGVVAYRKNGEAAF